MRPAVALFHVSIGHLLAGRRVVVLGVFAAVTALTVWLIAADSPDAAAVDVRGAVLSLLLPLLVPLVSLTFSTAALGDEIADGTAPNVVLKPIARGRIVIAKVASATGAALALLTPAVVAGHALAAGGPGSVRLLAATVVGVGAGTVAYCAVGVLLSLLTSRALVVGLAYMLLWEGTLVGLAPGLAAVSIRGLAESLFEAVLSEPGRVGAEVGPLQAALTALAVTVAAVWIAARRFERIDLD